MRKTNAKPELVIFDCDGVLVNSEPIASRIFHELITELGLDISLKETIDLFEGLSDDDCVRIVENRLGRPVPLDFMTTHDQRLFAALSDELEPIAFITEALDGISTPICVASSGPHEKIKLSLTKTGLLPRFDNNIFSAADVGRGKPFPDLFLHAAEKMGIFPKKCIVVEDSVYGVQAAVSAGMHVLGYADRTDAEVLSNAGAEVFHDMRKLPELINKYGSSPI